MKSHTATLAAVSAAVAIGAAALPSGAAAWQRCPPGSYNQQYCEPVHHHHHHPPYWGWGWGWGGWGGWGGWNVLSVDAGRQHGAGRK
jgi:hypothetical protein